MRPFLVFLISLLMAGPAAADRIPLSDLSGYLNDLQTAEGPFTQINSDGTVSTGRIYINRPGRARFEYESDALLVIAGGQQVAIFDGRSNTRPEQYPLSETPLSVILAQDVDLGRSGMVVGHEFDGTATRVTAMDPDRPEAGSIQMVFTADPVELRQWVITDQGGGQTTVVLGAMETGGRLRARLFSIPMEIMARENGN